MTKPTYLVCQKWTAGLKRDKVESSRIDYPLAEAVAELVRWAEITTDCRVVYRNGRYYLRKTSCMETTTIHNDDPNASFDCGDSQLYLEIFEEEEAE